MVLRWLSAWAISMAMMQAAAIEVHGHRGARMWLPENTLPAFRYAMDQGADFIELDTQVTSDGVLVVMHDPRMNEKHCKSPAAGAERTVHKMTLAEFRRWDCGMKHPDWPKQEARPNTPAPTLDEVFELMREYPRVKLNLEIKSEPKSPDLQPAPDVYARMVLAAIEKNRMQERVLVQSFDFAVLREMAKLPGAKRLPMSALFPNGDLEKTSGYAEIAQAAGGTGAVSLHLSVVTAEKVAAAHAAKIRVLAWTANTVADWDRLVAAGVDGVISDDPAGVIAFLKSKGLR